MSASRCSAATRPGPACPIAPSPKSIPPSLPNISGAGRRDEAARHDTRDAEKDGASARPVGVSSKNPIMAAPRAKPTEGGYSLFAQVGLIQKILTRAPNYIPQ